MIFSGAEIYLAIAIVLVGLIGNLKLYLSQSVKRERIKWNFSIYGTALIFMLCGLFSPPDILSNVILSGPFAFIYIVFLRAVIFKKRRINQANF